MSNRQRLLILNKVLHLRDWHVCNLLAGNELFLVWSWCCTGYCCFDKERTRTTDLWSRNLHSCDRTLQDLNCLFHYRRDKAVPDLLLNLLKYGLLRNPLRKMFIRGTDKCTICKALCSCTSSCRRDSMRSTMGFCIRSTT